MLHNTLIRAALSSLSFFSYQIVETLSQCGVAEADVGVVTLYRQQVHLLERKLQAYPEVEVLTADRSQGRDKECIVISCVRSNEAGQVSSTFSC